jgi:hypothetical protein
LRKYAWMLLCSSRTLATGSESTNWTMPGHEGASVSRHAAASISMLDGRERGRYL